MGTKTKVKAKARRIPTPLAAAVNVLLSREQVCQALGGISDRMLTKLVALEQFPKPDAAITPAMPRWSVEVVNEAIEGFRRGRGLPQGE